MEMDSNFSSNVPKQKLERAEQNKSQNGLLRDPILYINVDCGVIFNWDKFYPDKLDPFTNLKLSRKKPAHV